MKKPVSIFNYSVQNAAKNKVVIHIDGSIVDAQTEAFMRAWYGDTTSTSYKSFRNQLDKQDADEYDIIINCPGGHVGDALAIHDLIVSLQNKGKVVNTIGRGIIASAGTLILLSGNNPSMSENSWFMMHEVSGGIYGSVTEVENYAVTMRKFNDKIRDMYENKSNARKEEITKMMKAETWLTAQEAKEKGFIAEIEDEVTFENALSEDQFPFENKAIFNSYNQSVKPPAQQNQFEDMKKFFNTWGQNLLAALNGVKPENASDNKALLNSIGEVISNQFTAMGEAMEAEQETTFVNFLGSDKGKEAMKNFLTSDAGKEVIKNYLSSEDGKKVITDSLPDDLVRENELEAIKGHQQQGNGGKTDPKNEVIGSFD